MSRQYACENFTSPNNCRSPNDPNSPTTFYLTVDGKKHADAVRSESDVPDIVVKEGDV